VHRNDVSDKCVRGVGISLVVIAASRAQGRGWEEEHHCRRIVVGSFGIRFSFLRVLRLPEVPIRLVRWFFRPNFASPYERPGVRVGVSVCG
jgi:hypothetical protein